MIPEKTPAAKTAQRKQALGRLILGLVHPETGLVRPRATETSTTGYANVLAALSLVHMARHRDAIRLLGHFERYWRAMGSSFFGFPCLWDAASGLPQPASGQWERDAAGMLIAMTHCTRSGGSWRPHPDFVRGVQEWLEKRAEDAGQIVAEGLAWMYAALSPYGPGGRTRNRLEEIKGQFFSRGRISSHDYDTTLAHIAYGALMFGDTSGFSSLPRFARRQSDVQGVQGPVSAYAAYVTDPSISIEASALLFLAARNHPHAAPPELRGLEDELEKLWITWPTDPSAGGLAEITRSNSLAVSMPEPRLEPSVWYLFAHWMMNPFGGERTGVDDRAGAEENESGGER